MGWKSGVPTLVILRAEAEPADLLLVIPAPFRDVDV
jgi:hypothetical protein